MFPGLIRRTISCIIALAFVSSSLFSGYAAELVMGAGQGVLPAAQGRVSLSNVYVPSLLKGLKVTAGRPFQFDFILDRGDSRDSGDVLIQRSRHLVKYFLAAITVPEKDLWVNLSPHEKDRIAPEAFGQTEMGRDLLAQDYLLKQVTASLLYPEGETGKRFWSKIYEIAYARFGSTDIPVDAFNKVWIVPEKAVVYEKAQLPGGGGEGEQGTAVAYVVEAKLKVMLESDYLAQSKAFNASNAQATDETIALAKDVLREVVIPVLEKEVNEGENFAVLRQIYHSLILAHWYKKRIRESILSRKYADQNKVGGVYADDLQDVQRIYERYVTAFRQGAYNLIREEADPVTGELVPRKYFSGGANLAEIDKAMETVRTFTGSFASGQVFDLTVQAEPFKNPDPAQISGYLEDVATRVQEGQPLTIRAAMRIPGNDPERWKNYKVILHSNKDGQWQDGEELAFEGFLDGKAFFKTDLIAHRSFQYTFKFVDRHRGAVQWADRPFGDGRVWVDRNFEGEVVFVGMEYRPLIMKGGQGDVMYELPLNLVKAGIKNGTVIIPYFKRLAQQYEKWGYKLEDVPDFRMLVEFKSLGTVTLTAKRVKVGDVEVYLLDADRPDLFDAPYLQKELANGIKPEFYETILLSQGSTELLERLGKPVDIVVASDHHAALVPLYMEKKHAKFFEKTGRVLTIHNIGYQGQYENPEALLDDFGLENNEELRHFVIVRDWLEGKDKINMMAVPPKVAESVGYRGHFINPVSGTYGDEITDENANFEINIMLRKMKRAGHFGGIMNGLDMVENNPATDLVLKALGLPTYSIDDGREVVGAARAKIKDFLQENLGKDRTGTVAKLKIFEMDPEGTILTELIGKDVVEDVSDTEVRLRPGLAQKQELVREIAKEKFSEVWDILYRSQPVWWDSKKDSLKKHGYLVKGSNNQLLGMHGRMVPQKQYDILADILEDIAEGRREPLKIDVMIAGPADEKDDMESLERFIKLANDDRLRAKGINLVLLEGFIGETVNLMMAGTDDTLMPSRYEPAGLVQLKGERYGSPPIARKTGGLADTVFEGGFQDNGYLFVGDFRRIKKEEDAGPRKKNADGFFDAIKRSNHDFFNDPDAFWRKTENGMRQDNSWTTRQKDYLNVFAWLKDQLTDTTTDAAATPVGGIDLTAGWFSFESRGDSAAVSAVFAGIPVEDVDITEGLTPMVVGMAPVMDLAGFMGIPSGGLNETFLLTPAMGE